MRGFGDAVMPLFPGGSLMVCHLCADIGRVIVFSFDMRRFSPHAF
jgi:hypothetical protein